jgi:hypothetical protein
MVFKLNDVKIAVLLVRFGRTGARNFQAGAQLDLILRFLI